MSPKIAAAVSAARAAKVVVVLVSDFTKERVDRPSLDLTYITTILLVEPAGK